MRLQLSRWRSVSLLYLLFHHTQLARADSSESCDWNPLGPLQVDRHSESLPRCSLIVDDQSAIWTPWSVRPVCAHAKNGGTNRYCVFTKHGFRGTRGISILATPEIAAELAGLLHDPNPAWLHRQARLYYVKEDEGPLAYTVRDIPGRGKGMVANRTIRAGEVILRENPVIINLTELPPGVEPSQVGAMFDAAFDNLPAPERERVQAMARSKGDGHIINDILNTNAIGVKIGQNFLSALCPEVSVSLHTHEIKNEKKKEQD